MRIIYFVLQWTWEFPQTLFGFVASFILAKRNGIHKKIPFNYAQKTHIVTILDKKDRFFAGVSLGRYIVLHKHQKKNLLFHEIGHAEQSALLGWLYLFVVGIPSVLLNLYMRTKFAKRRFNARQFYYNSYPEKWANYRVNLQWFDMDIGGDLESFFSI